jgi:hypothetical protein
LVVEVEAATRIPVFDTVSTGVWKGLQVAGAPATALAPRWGTLFTHS